MSTTAKIRTFSVYQPVVLLKTCIFDGVRWPAGGTAYVYSVGVLKRYEGSKQEVRYGLKKSADDLNQFFVDAASIRAIRNSKKENTVAKNRGADFMLSRVAGDEPHPTAAQLDEVERYFDRAAANAGNIADGVGAAVRAIGALLNSGLTRKAICLLIQGTFGKGPGGKPKYSIETIDDILAGLEGLSEYLEKKR